MLRIGDLEKLRQAYSVNSDVTLVEVMRQLGDPSDQAIATFAAKQMSHSDRNVRVLALRVLAHQRGEVAMRGVLVGLHDEKRRVCAVAIQASANCLADEEVVARLEEIARDKGQKRKLRRRALSMLAGDEGRLQNDLTPAAAAALRRMMVEREYRFAIVFGLVRLELTARVRALLEEFARSTDGGLRRMAQRALRGELVVHIGRYEADKEMQRLIMETCEVAHGRMYYWLPRGRKRGCQPHPPAPSPTHLGGGATASGH